ncbi:hypothetical protein DPSP01_005101, partial [Paraphaeosphaeria sporulosa]
QSDGKVSSVHNKYYDDDNLPRNWGIIGNHFGRDGFPLVLSFPGDITSYDEKHDPPNYGRETPAEWEADKTRERPPKIEIFDRGSSIQDAEKEWYAKR